MAIIAKSYFRTWFMFDVLLVATEYVCIFLKGLSGLSMLRMARWGRLMRLLRFARLARLVKLKPLMQMLAVRFRLSSTYVEVTQGLVGMTVSFVVFGHILACTWHFIGQLFDDGWVQVNHFESADVAELYSISMHWTYSRLCFSSSGRLLETIPEFLLDACAMCVSFIFSSFYVAHVSSIVIMKAKNVNLHKASLRYAQKHKLSKELNFRLTRVLAAGHYLHAGERVAEEEHFLSSIPASLKKDLVFESRAPILIFNQLLADIMLSYPQVISDICNHAISQDVLVEMEVVFEFGGAGTAMRFVTAGSLGYLAHLKEEKAYAYLPKGSSVSEAVLWTDTEHLGRLDACEESVVLRLDPTKFSEIAVQHNDAYLHAVRYAKHFVWRLNRTPEVDDLTKFQELTVEVINEDLFEGTAEDHFVFISHYKVESGTEATLLHNIMELALRGDQSHRAHNFSAPIFIDSEDLTDLSSLKTHVEKSHILMVLLTPGIFSRPWCLVEIATAVRNNGLIVPVEVQRPGSRYQYPDEDFYKNLLAGRFLSADAVALLTSEGISLKEVELSLRGVFGKISLPFSPHKTKVVREAEVHDILKRCDSELSKRERPCGSRLSANSRSSLSFKALQEAEVLQQPHSEFSKKSNSKQGVGLSL
mmetsp:Transcript_57499/g.108185  ORF Transcript_57499/g.108185 Transcript_57499/m.108185 type:complete len:646 (+) Transcript_57499:3-1940(+)